MAAVLSIFKSVVVSIILLYSLSISSSDGGSTVPMNNYYRVELIHRDSARSPLMKPHNLTTAERVRLSHERSKMRLQRLQAKARGDNFYSPVSPNMDGAFLMQMGVGSPSPVLQHMLLDTGSDLVWLQCGPKCPICYPQKDSFYNPHASSTYQNLSCNSKFCTRSASYFCNPPDTCGYLYKYGGHSNTTGDLATETFSLKRIMGSSSSSSSSAWESLPSRLAFGCGHRQEGPTVGGGAGLVGFGRGVLSLPSQLGKTIKNKFSYCLGPLDDDAGVSSLILGDAPLHGRFQSTPFLRTSDPNYDPSFYYLDLHGISVGGTMIKYPASTFKSGGLIIDSGSTDTSLVGPAYEPFLAAVKSSIKAQPVNAPYTTYDLCYHSSMVSISKLPRIDFHFAGNATFVVPPRNSVVPSKDHQGRQLLCFAYSNAGTEGEVSIFGNTQHQNFNMIYDLGKSKLSFAPAVCDNL